MKAIHAVNAVPWQPGEQTHVSQTNKQTRQDDYYTRGRPRASGNYTDAGLSRVQNNYATIKYYQNNYAIIISFHTSKNISACKYIIIPEF